MDNIIPTNLKLGRKRSKEIPMDFAKGLGAFFGDDSHIYLEEGIEQFKDAYKFVKKNWKTVLPAVAIAGAAAYYMQHEPSRSRKARAGGSRRKKAVNH